MFGHKFAAGMAVMVGLTTACFSFTASATIWDITTVQSGSEGGFGFSLLHSASSTSFMTGTTLDTLSGSRTHEHGIVRYRSGRARHDQAAQGGQITGKFLPATYGMVLNGKQSADNQPIVSAFSFQGFQVAPRQG